MPRSSIAIAAGALAAISAPSLAHADTAELRSSYHGQGTWQEVSEGRTSWTGTFWLFSFNEAGEGFGHQMAWNCPATGMVADGVARFRGFCVKTDADGDQLFSSWQGTSPEGEPFAVHEVFDGGTGKYAGVSGEQDFTCYPVGPNQQGYCQHQVTYTLR